jgi:hypothetical protein
MELVKENNEPLLFSQLKRGSVFTCKGSYRPFIKHSDAVSLDVDGKDHCLSHRQEVFPKRVSTETFHRLTNLMIAHDRVLTNASIKRAVCLKAS